MVTTASKLYFAAAFLALVGSWVYGIGTDGELIGVVFLGFKGAVGEHIGYTVLQSAGWTLAGIGAASSILRDADPEAQAAAARLETLPPVVAPTTPSYWPVLGALSAVVAAVGLVASPVLFVIGLLGAGLVLLEWMVSAWSERATGDPTINRRIRNRLMYPIEIPVFGAVGIVVMVASVSRVFLTVDRISSSVIAIVLASLILLVGFLVSYRPKMGRNAIAGVLAVFGVLVIAGGIIGAANGTREFEHHETDHTDEPGAGGVEGEPDETDAGGGPDAGAEDDPPADDPGNDGDDDADDGTELPADTDEGEG